MGNVLTWKEALEASCQPELYSFENCPIGIVRAILDFKIWAKKTMAITCYFTSETGIAFRISVFRRQADKAYMLNNCDIDFTECPANRLYFLSIEKNGKGNPFIKSGSVLSDELLSNE